MLGLAVLKYSGGTGFAADLQHSNATPRTRGRCAASQYLRPRGPVHRAELLTTEYLIFRRRRNASALDW